MKKFITLSLAAAMIASMGVTAFAKKNDDEVADYDDIVLERTTAVVGEDFLYIPLRINGKHIDDVYDGGSEEFFYITDGSGAKAEYNTIDCDQIKDFDDMKLKVTINTGKDYVRSCDLDEIDDDDFDDFEFGGNSDQWNGVYAVCIELKDFYEADTLTIKGTAKIQKKGGSTIDDYDFNYKIKNSSSGNTVKIDDGEIKSAPKDLWTKDSTENNIEVEGIEVDDDEVTITYPEFDGNVVDFGSHEEMLYLEGEDFNFEVKLSDQGKVALKFDNDSIKSVARAADEDADLTFFNFKGNPEFDFTGTMTITLPDEDEEYWLYSIDEDGDLTEINAKLNDDDDALEFKARTLGSFVLSDMELDTRDRDDDDDIYFEEEEDDADMPVDDPIIGGGTTGVVADKNIPTTGSEDFVGVASALAAVSAIAAGAVVFRRKK